MTLWCGSTNRMTICRAARYTYECQCPSKESLGTSCCVVSLEFPQTTHPEPRWYSHIARSLPHLADCGPGNNSDFTYTYSLCTRYQPGIQSFGFVDVCEAEVMEQNSLTALYWSGSAYSGPYKKSLAFSFFVCRRVPIPKVTVSARIFMALRAPSAGSDHRSSKAPNRAPGFVILPSFGSKLTWLHASHTAF